MNPGGGGGREGESAEQRVHAWRHAGHAAVCDHVEPWEHGTVVRASRYESYFEYNLVRVEGEPELRFEELTAFADKALAGLGHRRIDFDSAEAAEPLRPSFEAAGWQALRLLWMRHEVPPPPGPAIAVTEVPYESTHELRVAWHQEDFAGRDPGEFHRQAQEVAQARGARVLATIEAGRPAAYAQLEQIGPGAEITQIYVDPRYRGGGMGTAMTRAAIEAAGDLDDLWICADDEDRPKELYARLGFRPVTKSMEFQRWP